MHTLFFPILLLVMLFTWLFTSKANAQVERWQQRSDYTMEIVMNTENHTFTGKQKIVYYNNSPDTLQKIFYHLFYNAFQPNSVMDIRSRTIEDPDRRVKDRIFKLKPNEIGYQKINALKLNGSAVEYKIEGTILEVNLNKPILPKSKVTLEMDFEAQVPVQIRRTGRNNAEGISYSMAQWYPRLCNYDYQGWHPNPYVGREFYGSFGDFDVKITIDSSFVIGGTGYLQNPQEIGKGYEKAGQKLKKNNSKTNTWHFKAPNVHDFAWAADPDYLHTNIEVEGVTLRFFFQKDNDKVKKNWDKLRQNIGRGLSFLNKNYGQYPYKQYAFIQGGDGGMEYPMCTLINGNGEYEALFGTAMHELIHSWYQGVLATNEALYAWMDEGFNTYVGDEFEGGNHTGTYNTYFDIVKAGKEEAMDTHADHFNTNRAYSVASYVKGSIFLHQLGYVIGRKNLDKGMKIYYDTWKFKHPNPNDFIRVMEKISGLELDWYKEYFVNTTHTIDYAIKNVKQVNNQVQIVLERKGKMPMPLDILVEYKDGRKEMYYIPLDLMRGEKPNEEETIKRIIKPDWAWTFPSYRLDIEADLKNIDKICIDKSQRMADVNRNNNFFSADEKIDNTMFIEKK